MKRTILFLSQVILIVFSSNAQYNLSWATSMGGSGIDAGTHVFTDASGNVYTTGYFDASADFDPGAGVVTLTTTGMEDVFITKQNSSGVLLWAKSIGGANTDMPAGIGVDNSGNVYVSGYYGGAVDLDPGPASYTFFAGSIEVFILKLDANGNFVWGQSMGSGGNDKAMTMHVDGTGNVYTAGYFEGTMDFDPGMGTYNITPFGSLGDIFVSKLTSAGNFAWAANIGGVDVENPYGICTDALANVYVTGFFENVCDFDPGAASFTLDAGATGKDAFVCKLDGNGNFVWAKQFGGTGDQHGFGVKLDGTGNIYISGDYQNTTDLDPGAGTFTVNSTSTFYSGFAVKLNSAGNFQWGKNITGNDDVIGNTIYVTSAGNVYWAGYNKGTADIDPGAGTNSVTAVTGYDSYISKLDNAGNYVSGETFPYVWGSFVVNASNEIILTGKYSGTKDFDPSVPTSNLSAAGQVDACVVKLNQLSTKLSENYLDASLALYPNPNNGKFTIELKEKASVMITNALGQTVVSSELGIGNHTLQLKEEVNGVYFAHFTFENGIKACTKFVIGN